MNNRIKFLVVLVGILVISLVGYGIYQNQYQTVTVSSPSGYSYTLSMYPATGNNESTSYDSSDPVLTTSEDGDYKIKKGSYVYVVDGPGKDYKQNIQPVSTDTGKINIKVVKTDYTPEKLQELLLGEKSAAEAAVVQQYPEQMKQYRISGGKLYKDGTWYAAKLVPNDSQNLDELRIVLHKINGRWEVITQPPEIVLSSPVYPDIPHDILSDINNF